MNFTMATPEHGTGLRQLARELSMPGWIRLAYTHNPDWFTSHAVLGHTIQTIIGTHADGRVAGCGVRAVRRVYINGAEAEIGYLCGLRSHPAVRNHGYLSKGYRFLRRLHNADHLCQAYLTTIIEDNTFATSLLTSGRAGLPAYLDQGRIINSAIPLGQWHPPKPPASLAVRAGSEIPLADIVAFLNREGRKRLFFPLLAPEDFATQRLAGLKPEHFHVALEGNKIVGITAAWDQQAFRQCLVTGYAPALQLTRPLLNLCLRFRGRSPLPPPGGYLNFFHAAFTCIHESNPNVLAVLLGSLHSTYRNSSYHYFVIGLHERDPLRTALNGFPSFDYHSHLYLACWDDGRAFCNTLDPDMVPHIETAMM